MNFKNISLFVMLVAANFLGAGIFAEEQNVMKKELEELYKEITYKQARLASIKKLRLKFDDFKKKIAHECEEVGNESLRQRGYAAVDELPECLVYGDILDRMSTLDESIEELRKEIGNLKKEGFKIEQLINKNNEIEEQLNYE